MADGVDLVLGERHGHVLVLTMNRPEPTLSDAAAGLEREKSRGLRGSPEQVKCFRAATKKVTGR